jgi:hypothetical protein
MTESQDMHDAWVSVQTRQYAESVLAPVDPGEAETAIRAALEAVGVAPNRARVYPPTLRIEKPPERNGAPTRMVWVRIRDRDRRLVHEVTVHEGSVIDHVESDEASPPFSDEERDEATQVLSAQSRFSQLLAEADTEIEWFSAGHGPERLLGARLVRIDSHQVVEIVTDAIVDVDGATLVHGGEQSE